MLHSFSPLKGFWGACIVFHRKGNVGPNNYRIPIDVIIIQENEKIALGVKPNADYYKILGMNGVMGCILFYLFSQSEFAYFLETWWFQLVFILFLLFYLVAFPSLSCFLIKRKVVKVLKLEQYLVHK